MPHYMQTVHNIDVPVQPGSELLAEYAQLAVQVDALLGHLAAGTSALLVLPEGDHTLDSPAAKDSRPFFHAKRSGDGWTVDTGLPHRIVDANITAADSVLTMDHAQGLLVPGDLPRFHPTALHRRFYRWVDAVDMRSQGERPQFEAPPQTYFSPLTVVRALIPAIENLRTQEDLKTRWVVDGKARKPTEE